LMKTNPHRRKLVGVFLRRLPHVRGTAEP